jgi:RNA polymerase sigma-70 factor (ECF subfamily)
METAPALRFGLDGSVEPIRDGDDEGDPDADVVGALAVGDQRQALFFCARRHAAAIGRLCMALLGSQADADDTLQETLLEAHDALPSWRREGSLRSFMLTIARRKCARLLETRGRRSKRLELVRGAEPPSRPSAEHAVVAAERAERARAALALVRPSEREALVLRYGAELSFREVGAACGIDEAAARKRVSRALGAMRRVLGDVEPLCRGAET